MRNAHIFHISNRPIVRRLSGCEGDEQRGFSFTSQSWCVMCMVCTHHVNLLLNHVVHNCRVHKRCSLTSQSWCARCTPHLAPSSFNPPSLSTPPSLSGLKFKTGKLKAGIWPAGKPLPPCPTSRSLTRDHFRLHTPENPPPKSSPHFTDASHCESG